MPKVVVALTLCIAVAAAALAILGGAAADYLSATISIAALVISLLAAFKEDIFPFRPKVFMDEIILAAPGMTDQVSPSIVLPIVFINEGHGSGVIQGLTLKVETTTSTMVYTPVAEIDQVKFITGKRGIHAENMLGAFNMFQMNSRGTVKRYILFTQEPASKRYPFSTWNPAQHVFRLYMKHSGSSIVVQACSSGHAITGKLLADYQAGTSASLSPDRELDA